MPYALAINSGGTSAQQLGGWYDPLDADENGDKCAWVGENLLTAQGPRAPGRTFRPADASLPAD